LKRRGFTLIELLLASALTSLLIGAAVGVFAAVHKNTAKARAHIELTHVGRALLDDMSRHVACMWSYMGSKDELLVAVTEETGTLEGENGAGGEPRSDELHFVARCPVEPRGTDFVEISYFVHEDEDTGRKNLIRRWQAPPDEDITMGGRYEALSDRVVSLAFEYYDGFEWTDDWPYIEELPDAVRITLGLADETTSSNVTLTVVVDIPGAKYRNVESPAAEEEEKSEAAKS